MVEDINAHFVTELNPGEQILWSGQPQQGFILRRSDLILIPASLLVGALVLPLEIAVIGMAWQLAQMGDHSQTATLILGALLAFALFGLPFVVLAGFLLLGRFWFDRLRRRKTFYAFTQQRVLICSTILKRRIRSVALDQKIKVTLTPHPHGIGSLYLNMDVYLWWWLMGPPWWLPFWLDVEVYQPPFVERIADAAQVYAILQNQPPDTGDDPL